MTPDVHAPTAGHPYWCNSSSTVNCGDHLSAPVDVPATAGRWRPDCAGAAFPRLQAAASLSDDGTRGVLVTVFDPTGDEDRHVEVTPTPAEARRYAAAIVAAADLAESGYSMAADSARLRVV